MIELDDVKEFTTFEPGGVYVFIALARKRENPDITRNTELLFRETATSTDDIDDVVQRLSGEIDHYDKTFRLYMSINRRDAVEASFLLLQEIDSMKTQLVYGNDEVIEQFERLGSDFRSCLQKPMCKDEQHFLIDVDDPALGQVDEMRTVLGEFTTIRLDRQTPNGHHFVVDAFDPRLLQDDVDFEYERKNDANVFLGYL